MSLWATGSLCIKIFGHFHFCFTSQTCFKPHNNFNIVFEICKQKRICNRTRDLKYENSNVKYEIIKVHLSSFNNKAYWSFARISYPFHDADCSASLPATSQIRFLSAYAYLCSQGLGIPNTQVFCLLMPFRILYQERASSVQNW